MTSPLSKAASPGEFLPLDRRDAFARGIEARTLWGPAAGYGGRHGSRAREWAPQSEERPIAARGQR